jgi:hypothetical protein
MTIALALGHIHDRTGQVVPKRVDRFNEANPPRAIPFFELPLPLNGILRSRKRFAIDQLMDIVLLGEPLEQTLLVFPHPTRKIIRHTDIKSPIRFAGKNIDIVLAAHRSVKWIPAFVD